MEAGLFDVETVVARLEPGRHPHEAAHREAIDANWARRLAANPHLYNGATVLGTGWRVAEKALTLACRQVEYATLLHWIATYGVGREDLPDRPRVPADQVHFFTNPVIVGSDGHVVMGRMAAHTYNAGKVYMPSGSFEPGDFSSGTADFCANMRREVLEETGLDLARSSPAPGYRVYYGGNFLATFQVYRFAEPAASLAGRAAAFIADGGDGELSQILTVAPGETRPDMPRHVRAFMAAFTG
ncbi:MAG: DNA mismatch repair protein MutT [Alphaproteobacteria bacterium]|nr:MAG: DNA mismatch repair protein MutT [Alphaproteobacteria bacterium]